MSINLNKLKHQDSGNFFLIAGPCAIEGEAMAFEIAEAVVKITNRLEIPYIFKGLIGKQIVPVWILFTGIGDIKALEILKKIGMHFDIPVTTDIHSVEEAAIAAEYVDVLQIPAFCRQTDLLVAAAKTGKVVNIKKVSFEPCCHEICQR